MGGRGECVVQSVRCAHEWRSEASEREAGCEFLHLPSLISFLFSPERTLRSGIMEDVYPYSRSPAWEELVSNVQNWWRLCFESLRIPFYFEFFQRKENCETSCVVCL